MLENTTIKWLWVASALPLLPIALWLFTLGIGGSVAGFFGIYCCLF